MELHILTFLYAGRRWTTSRTAGPASHWSVAHRGEYVDEEIK